jgi:uncharacterized iron-regulated membrane protein
MHDALLKIHRYVALGVSLVLVVVGVTGCLLVFELRMDRWLDPQVSYVEPRETSVPLAQILAKMKSQLPARRSPRSMLAALGHASP